MYLGGRVRVLRGIRAATGGAFAALVLAAPAGAQEQFSAYAGDIPFNCKLQNVGTGTDFPDPDADPFCVEFDKTQQNVTDFGLVDFLAQEPARVAQASPKCFYFQRDHWTGTIVQGGEPEVWHWDGDYWFNKATGSGGVSVRNFRVGGQPQSAAPFAPPEYAGYFDQEGGGGVEAQNSVEPDPRCAEMVDSRRERLAVYRTPVPGGKIRRKRVGRARLLTLRQRLIEEVLGPPDATRRHTDRFEVAGGGELRVGWRGTSLDRRVAAFLVTSKSYSHRGVPVGARARAARNRLGARRAFRLSGFRVLETRRFRRSRLFIGVRGGRIAWIAIVDPRVFPAPRGLRRTLRRLVA